VSIKQRNCNGKSNRIWAQTQKQKHKQKQRKKDYSHEQAVDYLSNAVVTPVFLEKSEKW
jgi:hypothetical protein